MSCKRTIHEWRHAIDVLTSYAIEFSGMEDKILPVLKYSYNYNLNGEQIKSCLLYCSLFPEDYEIPKARLIDYWICEGIIDGSESLERAENKGYEIISSLVRASLLMDEGEIEFVRMHDVVREMALWIATDLGREREAFIVHAGIGLYLYGMPKVNDWNAVKRMSLMYNKNNCLDGSPKRSELTILLLQETNTENISREFFKFMPKLAVLDLSYHQNPNLYGFELHGISELVSLQYLNLSKSGLRHLPTGLQKLKRLIHLDLEFTPRLKSIAGISSLQTLKVLKLLGSRCSQDLKTVKELETMEHLEILTIGIENPRVLNILSSRRLASCTRALKIKNIRMESSGISLQETMDKLRDLSIFDSTITEINMGRIGINPLHNPRNPCFFSLSKVVIHVCKRLRELTLLMFAPNLRELAVRGAHALEDIINKEKACELENSGIAPFPNLARLDLSFLPKLKNIYWGPLPFRHLKRIDVISCPNLRKLPLDSQSGKQGENVLIIRYREKEWIDVVEWEDEATKTRFLSSCKKY